MASKRMARVELPPFLRYRGMRTRSVDVFRTYCSMESNPECQACKCMQQQSQTDS